MAPLKSGDRYVYSTRTHVGPEYSEAAIGSRDFWLRSRKGENNGEDKGLTRVDLCWQH